MTNKGKRSITIRLESHSLLWELIPELEKLTVSYLRSLKEVVRNGGRIDSLGCVLGTAVETGGTGVCGQWTE